MEKIIDIPIINASKQSKTYYGRIDPSKTLPLQNAFVRAMNAKFYKLKASIRKAIIQDDIFGLKKQLVTQAVVLPGSPGWHAFDFATSQQKVENFMNWLNKQIDDDLLQVKTIQRIGGSINEAWTDRWIADSYKRGLLRARYELKKAGYNVPGMNETGGIEASMSTPFNMDVVGVLYTRTFEGLKGITSAMSHQISQVLSQGMIDGDGTTLLAKKLVAVIDGTGMGALGIKDTLGRFIPAQRRAELLARTEIMRAHHVAMVQEYKNWKANNVIVKAEWATAGDIHVCDICSSMEGSVWTLNQIQNMIPAHPLCRCVAIPTKKVLKKPGQEVKSGIKKKDMTRKSPVKKKKPVDFILQKMLTRFKDPKDGKLFEQYYKEYTKFFDNKEFDDFFTFTRDLIQNKKEYVYLDKYEDILQKIKENLPDSQKWRDIFRAWQSSTQKHSAQYLRYLAQQYEKDLPDLVFKRGSRGLDEMLKDVKGIFGEEQKEAYLRMRAYMQAYMRRLYPEGELELWRGVGGRTGGSIARSFYNMTQGNLARTKIPFNDMTLVGYADDFENAYDFGRGSLTLIDDSGKVRAIGFRFVTKKVTGCEEIVVPRELFSWLTGVYMDEREFIVLGNSGEYELKNVYIRIMIHEDRSLSSPVIEEWKTEIGSSGIIEL